MLKIGKTSVIPNLPAPIPEPHLKKFSEFERIERRKQEERVNPDTLIKQFLNQLNSTYTDDEGKDVTEWFYFLIVGNPVALDL